MSISSHFLLTDVNVASAIICPLVLYIYLSVTLVTAAQMVGLLQIDITFSCIWYKAMGLSES